MPFGNLLSSGLVPAALFGATSPPTPHLFDGLVGPIVRGYFEVDELSLTILIGLMALGALLILSAPATGDFFRYLSMLLFFLICAFGIVTARNVVTFIVGWEITSLFAWGIGQIKGIREDNPEAGVVPFQAAGALGSFAMLLGLALLAINRRSLILGPPDPGSILGPVPYLILVGIILKTFGLLSEGWYLRPGRSFSIASATLAGAGVLTIGMYPFFRFFGPILDGATDWRGTAILATGALTILAALAALGEVDGRRALSYGAFSQFCLLATIYLIGTPAALAAAIIGAIANAFAFTGLFLALSATEEATTQVLLRQIGGLAQRLPVTAALFVICSLSIVGLPPLGGFIVDRLIGVAAQQSELLPLFWMVAAGLTILYLIRLFAALFLGELRGPVRRERRGPVLLVGSGVVGALLLLGFISADLFALLEPIARLLPG